MAGANEGRGGGGWIFPPRCEPEHYGERLSGVYWGYYRSFAGDIVGIFLGILSEFWFCWVIVGGLLGMLSEFCRRHCRIFAGDIVGVQPALLSESTCGHYRSLAVDIIGVGLGILSELCLGHGRSLGSLIGGSDVVGVSAEIGGDYRLTANPKM